MIFNRPPPLRPPTSRRPFPRPLSGLDVRNPARCNVLRVISNLHLGQCDTTPEQSSLTFGHDPFMFCHKDLMIALLRDTASNSLVSHLILNGNIFDNWSTPLEKMPLSITSVMESHGWFVELIRQIHFGGKAVIYVCGNCDSDVTDSVLTNVFGNGIVHFGGSRFVLGSMVFEHGHRFDLINMDGTHLPLGYYAHRILSTCGGISSAQNAWQNLLLRFRGRGFRALASGVELSKLDVQEICRFFERLASKNEAAMRGLVRQFLKSQFVNGVHPSFDTPFCVRMGEDLLETTLERVIRSSEAFFSQARETYGDVDAVRFLKASSTGDKIAEFQTCFAPDILNAHDDTTVIVFGNCIHPRVELLEGRLICANSGSWLGGMNARTRPSVVDVSCGLSEKVVQVWYPELAGIPVGSLVGSRPQSERVAVPSRLVAQSLIQETPQRYPTDPITEEDILEPISSPSRNSPPRRLRDRHVPSVGFEFREQLIGIRVKNAEIRRRLAARDRGGLGARDVMYKHLRRGDQ